MPPWQIPLHLRAEMTTANSIKNILYYEPGAAVGYQGVGGSLVSLLQMVRSLDRKLFRPVIVLLEPFDICNEYRKSGCKVIIKGEGASAPGGIAARKGKAANGVRKKLPRPRWLTECKVIAQSLDNVQFLRKVIQSERIDMIHCNHGLGAHIEGLLAAFICAKPCICHTRAYHAEAISPIFRFLGRVARKHVAISRFISQDLRNKGFADKDIVLLSNWIDTVETPRLQTQPQVHSRDLPFQIVCMGRFIPWKGQELLVEAARELKARGYSFQISFYGEAGPAGRAYLEAVTRRVTEYGLQEQVRFAGYQPYAEVFRNPFHLLVHTSIKPEPFGRVIIEGMYNSIPVIGSGLGGVLDIICDGENGLLFDPATPGDLVKKIILLMDHNERRMALAARGYATVLEHFSETGKREKLSEIYCA
jgi:glycosyltransferase involved in cell wall biosynthesis